MGHKHVSHSVRETGCRKPGLRPAIVSSLPAPFHRRKHARLLRRQRTVRAQAAEVVASKVAGAADVSRDGKFLVYGDAGNDPAKTGQRPLVRGGRWRQENTGAVRRSADGAGGPRVVSPDGALSGLRLE